MNTMLAVEIMSVPKSGNEIDRAVLYILCDNKRKPVPGIMITGVGGDLNGSDRTPFMILKDGRGDYGCDYDDPTERFFQTNLRAKNIYEGEFFTVTSADPEQPARQIETTFRFSKTTVIAGPGSK